ncbi:MAG: polyphosphate kinase 2 family protein [Pelolinea sp.]|nr:polyphosphate kinase 2 family protein [Pelolinea sp.]
MHAYQIKENIKLTLKEYDPNDTKLWDSDKKAAKNKLEDLRKQLIDLQRLLYAEHKQKVLIILQAMDSGGKDGTIRSIFKGVNPQGVRVASFKVPTPEESKHDYLWRIHKQTPRSGEIVIFNRSHYEDVLVVRVHQLIADTVWKKRYEQIRHFEKLLADEGTTIIKFFLHISKDEQKERFLERIDIPEKQWKFNPRDIEERKLWGNYMQAYEDAISKTSTSYAPWYVIPANRNWYRDYVITKIITDVLKKKNMTYPNPVEDLEKYRTALD